MRKSSWIIPAILLLTTLGCTAARADVVTDDFTITGGGIAASGTITLMTTATPGVDEITGITGNFSTTNDVGFSGSIAGVIPVSASNSASSPTSNTIAVFDNLLYPAGTAPGENGYAAGGLLDYWGLAFTVGTTDWVNIFTEGPSSVVVNDGVTQSAYAPEDDGTPVSFTIIPTPEPSSLGLLLFGVGLVFVMRKRISRNLPQAS
jgi:hypothetical protein